MFGLLTMGLSLITGLVPEAVDALTTLSSSLGPEYAKYSFADIEGLSAVVLALILTISTARLIYLIIAMGQSDNLSQEKRRIKNLVIAVIIAILAFSITKIILMYVA